MLSVYVSRTKRHWFVTTHDSERNEAKHNTAISDGDTREVIMVHVVIPTGYVATKNDQIDPDKSQCTIII